MTCWIVTRKFQGVAIYHVKAETSAEAKETVLDGCGEPDDESESWGTLTAKPCHDPGVRHAG